MIKADQPTIFGDGLRVGISSREDGQMQHGWVEQDDAVTANRRKFIEASGLTIEQSTLVRVQYADDASYDQIVTVTKTDAGMGMYTKEGTVADCLVTTTKNLGLFLPIADCGATVVYDPSNKVLALAHLGRHSTVANLAHKLVNHLVDTYQTKPSALKIWVSPSISAEHYILEYADFANGNPDWDSHCTTIDGRYAVNVTGYNLSQFISAGVLAQKIQVSEVDTAASNDYWSHHQQKNVRGQQAPPRFAVVAALK